MLLRRFSTQPPVLVRRYLDKPQQFGHTQLGVELGLVRKGNNAVKPQTRLLEKRIKDSIVSLVLPFASDEGVRSDYELFNSGAVRMGKILEDLDAVAGLAAYRHCDDGDDSTLPLNIVTASCDRIELRGAGDDVLSKDVRCDAACTWVGKSSMNIEVELSEHLENGKLGALILRASFTFVARGANGAAPVNRLMAETEQEKSLFKQGAAQQQRRRAARGCSIMVVPPTGDELAIVHEQLMHGEGGHEQLVHRNTTDAVAISSTVQNNLMVCHGQNRNIHDKIFGGWLMREALELSFATASEFIGAYPKFVAMDDVRFVAPVEIGALLHLRSQVAFTEGAPHRTLSVTVAAAVQDLGTSVRTTTNTFQFVFQAPAPPHVAPLQKVVPHSYNEAMDFLQARRRHLEGRDAYVEREKMNRKVDMPRLATLLAPH